MIMPSVLFVCLFVCLSNHWFTTAVSHEMKKLKELYCYIHCMIVSVNKGSREQGLHEPILLQYWPLMEVSDKTHWSQHQLVGFSMLHHSEQHQILVDKFEFSLKRSSVTHLAECLIRDSCNYSSNKKNLFENIKSFTKQSVMTHFPL